MYLRKAFTNERYNSSSFVKAFLRQYSEKAHNGGDIMRIEIIKNRETSLVIDDIGTAIEDDCILKDGYIKAHHALKRYIIQTSKIRHELSESEKSASQIHDILYQSPQNIIAFTGKRGTGKTSAMISFSEYLKSRGECSHESRKKWKENFESLHTLVLSPIDPTMLENDQDILSVVLSRLLYKAEERWDNNLEFHRGARYLEKAKNELLKKANDCMNGILAVKKRGEIKGLADLQRVGDSAVLKKNLFDLVNLVNMFCLGTEDASVESSLLVIPIDDTDCQIKKAHEVLEDIRRYLTIPNVIILMATDGDMLRKVFAQHYANEFDVAIKKGFLETDDMEHYAEKVLTKLIPGTQRIYLPAFESLLEGNSVRLELGYYDDDKKDRDLISDSTRLTREQVKNKENDIDFNFSAKVLTFIYKRTGIVFSEHDAYINNIIPTTMRGLAHLLNYLYSMEDVNEIDYTHDYTPQEFVEITQNRIKSLEKNLDSFEEYFMNEWVPAKVSGDMVKILKGIQEQVPANVYKYAFDEMYDKYIVENGQHSFFSPDGGDSYYRLMQLLGAINGTIKSDIQKTKKHRTDYYNTFAIRTLITIKNNKQALNTKLNVIERFNQATTDEKTKGLDYSLCTMGDSLPHRIQNEVKDNQYLNTLEPVVNLFSELLKKGTAGDDAQTPFERFCLQEVSWIVLCNWEVHDIIHKSIESYRGQEGEKNTNGLWNSIQESISGKNCGMLKPVLDKCKDIIRNSFNKFNSILPSKENTNSINKEDGNKTDTSSVNADINMKAAEIERKLQNPNIINSEIFTKDLEVMLDSLEQKRSDIKAFCDNNMDKEAFSAQRAKQLVKVNKSFDNLIIRGRKIRDDVANELKQTDTKNGTVVTTSKIDKNIKARIKRWLSSIKTEYENADNLMK